METWIRTTLVALFPLLASVKRIEKVEAWPARYFSPGRSVESSRSSIDFTEDHKGNEEGFRKLRPLSQSDVMETWIRTTLVALFSLLASVKRLEKIEAWPARYFSPGRSVKSADPRSILQKITKGTKRDFVSSGL